MDTVFRFGIGANVYVVDGQVIDFSDRGLLKEDPHVYRSLSIVAATVRELHSHPERDPTYPGGEGYALDGILWWDCYPGSRVFATREEAEAARPDLEARQQEDAQQYRDEIILDEAE
jgi:hypothetical protein